MRFLLVAIVGLLSLPWSGGIGKAEPATVRSLPTACLSFSDDPLDESTPVRAIHIAELRSCVAALRAEFSLSSVTWTDSALVADNSTIRAAHIAELRSALDEVFVAAGLTVPSYTDPSITAGATAIKRVHVTELRSAARSLDYPAVATPVLSLSSGQYSVTQTLTMSCATSGATIRYTTDGSAPSPTSPTYAGAIQVDASQTISARAYKTGLVTSEVAASAIELVAVAPTFSPPAGAYGDFPLPSLSTATPSATIRYTTDGSEPTSSSLAFTAAISVTADMMIKAKTFRAGWTTSSTASAGYILQATQPTPTPAAGIYEIGQTVTVAGNPSSENRCTTDGSEPTSQSSICSQMTLSEPTTIKAKAFRTGFAPSVTLVAAYGLHLPAPTVSPEEGVFDTMPQVTLTTSTSGATIRYTTDRSEPTENSSAYISPISADDDTTVKAQLYKAGWSPSAVVTRTYLNTTALNPPSDSVGVVSIGGTASPSGLNSLSSTVQFSVSGTLIDTTFGSVSVRRNLEEVPSFQESVQVTGVQVLGMVDGQNDIELRATDADGGLIYETVTVWAGSRTLQTTVFDPWGVLAGATVVAMLDDDRSVTVTGSTDSAGHFQLNNLPTNAAVWLTVSKDGYRPASFLIGGGTTSTTVTLDTSNIDFSQGLDGWNWNTPLVLFVEHSEASLPPAECTDCIARGIGVEKQVPDSNTARQQSALGQPAGISQAARMATNTSVSDWDLIVTTKNAVGAQTVSRTFDVAPGTSKVTVRYRFQSDEIWSGYNGPTHSYQADSYAVSVQSLLPNGSTVSDTQTVATLFGQFDSNAATPWKTLSLPTNVNADTVQVTISVANAVDAALMSWMYVDVITEQTHQIDRVRLFDLINPNDPQAADRNFKPLQGLSVSAHSFYDGYTRIHGAIRVVGPPTDSLAWLALDVFENGQKKVDGNSSGVGNLARTQVSGVRSALLNTAFGQHGVSVGFVDGQAANPVPADATPVLFEIPSAALGDAVNQTTNGIVTLQIRGKSTGGVEFGPFPVTVTNARLNKFVLYSGANRFGTRDETDCSDLPSFSTNPLTPPADRWKVGSFPCGGDGWALPSVKAWAGSIVGVTWNDFSNMNGGSFPIHKEHRDGFSIDGLFPGYVARDQTVAVKMLDYLNQYGRQITNVYVTFARKKVNNMWKTMKLEELVALPTGANAFWDAIRFIRLKDGRCAAAVITNVAGHADHFHWNVNPAQATPPAGAQASTCTAGGD